jgi:cytoskeletal protein RodZ
MAESHDAEALSVADIDTAGSRLRAARVKAKLSQADIAARTKIPERHIVSIEAGDYDALAGRSYATGFSRSYARAVGLDGETIVQMVRHELGHGQLDDRRQMSTFEPGDPSRVPGQGVVWIGVVGVVAIVVGVLIFWRSFWSPAAELPSLLPPEASASAAPAAVRKAPVAAPAPAQGPVTLTATENEVWVRVFDAQNKQLLEKTLALGESYTVPADAQSPQLRTGRPDALRIAIGARELPPLSTEPVAMTVSLAPAELLARPAPSPSPTSPASR